jgi:hypothetical protein
MKTYPCTKKRCPCRGSKRVLFRRGRPPPYNLPLHEDEYLAWLETCPDRTHPTR